MDEAAKFPQYGSRILGIDRSLQYVQKKVESIEKSKKFGTEVVHRRKEEILQTALENDATLTRIGKSQETIQKVAKAAAIGLVCLYAIKVVREGLGLIQGFSKRRNSKKKGTEGKERSEDGKLSKILATLGGRNSNLHPRRLHARHWQVCEPLES